MRVHTLSAFDSNYLWLLQPDEATPEVIAIDPGDARVVREYLQTHQLCLQAIWNTHHHADHTGGNLALQAWAKCPVVGMEADRARLPGFTTGVGAGDRIPCGWTEAVVLATPGHTHHHCCYWIPQTQLLFCGDTLFSLGCGRLFEGTAVELWASLAQLKALPEETLVYAAHEYTLANGRFAQAVMPDNAALNAYLAACQQLRNAGKPTLPTTIGREKALNPFLRASGVEELAALRLRKDTF